MKQSMYPPEKHILDSLYKHLEKRSWKSKDGFYFFRLKQINQICCRTGSYVNKATVKIGLIRLYEEGMVKFYPGHGIYIFKETAAKKPVIPFHGEPCGSPIKNEEEERKNDMSEPILPRRMQS